MTTLPLDSLGNPIPTLGYVDGGARTVALTASSARNASGISTGTRVVTLYATVPCFIRLGDNTVTATSTDHYFPADVYYDIAVGADSKDRFIAAIRAGATDGTLYISERQ